MIPDYLSAIVSKIAPAMADHLWQSTLFAIAAALLTLALRRNQARIRHSLWLAASLKFLVPFSLLIALGSHLRSPHASATAQSGLYSVMEEAGQPFTQAVAPAVAPPAPTASAAHLLSLLPEFLAAVWLCGFVAVLFVWTIRWRRISVVKGEATPMRDGREMDALYELEWIADVRKPIALLLSRASLEPGVLGIVRPALIWPDGISQRLDDAHLKAILVHELWHIRRRDNLAAAMHMVVEAVFWFHPLVWWLGTRLVEERERACDEGVLEFSEPDVYAESILKTCEYCVGSPLACVSGVTGADLKRRIVDIMAEHATLKLDLLRKSLLGAAGIVVVAAPFAFGLLHPPEGQKQAQVADTASIPVLKFDVVSIRPDNSGDGPHILSRFINPPDDGSFYATNVSLRVLLGLAYGLQNFQITGTPDWLNSVRYDIAAKSDSPVNAELRKLDPDQRKLAKQRIVQALLADRFQLKLHRSTKELPVYDLVVADGGAKLQPAIDTPGKMGSPDSSDFKEQHFRGNGLRVGLGQLSGQAVPLPLLATGLSNQVGRVVVDRTGLKGLYDFTLQWMPDESRAPLPGMGESGASSFNSSGPSLFTAIQEQLGLKLESTKGPVEILVIDHIERPSAN